MFLIILYPLYELLQGIRSEVFIGTVNDVHTKSLKISEIWYMLCNVYCNNDILEYSIFHKSHQYTDVYTTILVFINTRCQKDKIHTYICKKEKKINNRNL